MTASTTRVRFQDLLPEPRRLWIRHRPVSWPGAGGFWLDLAGPRLGGAGRLPVEPPANADLRRLDDLVYLPPVAEGWAGQRAELAGWLHERGVPYLWQARPGEPAAATGATAWDLTEALLAGDLEAVAGIGDRDLVVWPWIAGLTDRRPIWEEGLERLQTAGASGVVPVVPDLAPRQRRELAEAAELRGYTELFHRAPRPLAPFARAAHGRGLSPFPARPLPPQPRRLALNRAVAGHLAEIGELELGLGGSEVEAQTFFRAARRADQTPHDLEGLLREGNLGVLGWLEEPARAAAVQFLERRGSTALEERRAAYLGTR